MEAETKEDKVSVKTEALTIDASTIYSADLDANVVKADTCSETDDATYNIYGVRLRPSHFYIARSQYGNDWGMVSEHLKTAFFSRHCDAFSQTAIECAFGRNYVYL